VHLETIEDGGHGYFGDANDEDFMSLLISQLQTWPHVPVGECLNESAYDYESGDYCEDRWRTWDNFCEDDASASEKAGICA